MVFQKALVFKMKFLIKTKVLLLSAVLVGGLALWDLVPTSEVERLPRLSSMLKDDIRRIELTQMGNTIVLENTGGEWVQLSPLAGSADWPRIKSMILNFRKSVPMDVLVEVNPDDEGREYGLDASNSITVEMWSEGSSDPIISFLLGQDTGQGSSFVRITGEDKVYRASVGGRRRFAYSADGWLNQRLFPFDFAEVSTIDVELGFDKNTEVTQTKYSIQRDSNWTILDYPELVNQERLGQALQSLSVMRVGEKKLDAEVDGWLAMNFALTDGSSVQVKAGTPTDRQSLVQIKDSIFLVPALPIERFSQGPQYFKDSRVFPIRSREELDLIRYKTDVVDIIIQQDLSNGFWKVLQPSNIDLEMREVFFMVNTLSSLSSIKEVSIESSLEPKITLEIRRLNGEIFRLFVYSRVESGVLCKVEGSDFGFVAIVEDVERIINGFGQAEKL